MSDKQNEDLRPDPQALLKETKSNSRGKLKLFLGAAPGVGKTYAMLTEAREKRKEGLDVIIGWVDTHGRKDTEALVKGLELVPRLKVVINGHTYEKLDVQSIIKRSPVTVIIDEMPHSNPPGSLHKKRWQDIDEILDEHPDMILVVDKGEDYLKMIAECPLPNRMIIEVSTIGQYIAARHAGFPYVVFNERDFDSINELGIKLIVAKSRWNPNDADLKQFMNNGGVALVAGFDYAKDIPDDWLKANALFYVDFK